MDTLLCVMLCCAHRQPCGTMLVSRVSHQRWCQGVRANTMPVP